jgi:hypothetical protein
MSRPNVGDLGSASPPYRPGSKQDAGGNRIESKHVAARENETRRALIMSSMPLLSAAYQPKARDLAGRLAEGDERSGWSKTLASARYIRDQRDRVGGAVWALADNAIGPVATFTVIPPGWSLSPYELAAANPKKMMATFRSDLNRSGAAGADGWAITLVHGEFDPGRVHYQLHLHGVAVGGMIDVVRALSDRPKYASSRLGERPDDGVFQRIRVSRKPLTNLPSPLTYILQPFWPSRWSGDTGDGVINRQRTKHRIPEPYHTQYLLWLDQWALSDIALLMKLRVQSGRLISK